MNYFALLFFYKFLKGIVAVGCFVTIDMNQLS